MQVCRRDSHPGGRRARYGSEEKAVAVRMVRTLRDELGTGQGTVTRVAHQLGYGVESVRSWVRSSPRFRRGERLAEIGAVSHPSAPLGDSSPWQRGTSDNPNVVLRQRFPKGTDLSRWSAEEIEAVVHTPNTRPRETLG